MWLRHSAPHICRSWIILFALASEALAQSASFTALGHLSSSPRSSVAYGISADGLVVIGTSATANGWEPYQWTAAGGMVSLGLLGGNGGYAASTTNDGSVVVGSGVLDDTGNSIAVRWSVGGSTLQLGDFPGGQVGSFARAVSGDDSVVVGDGQTANGGEAFRWTPATGLVGLGDLAGGPTSSVAMAVSSDGSVIAGTGTTALDSEAFIWTNAGGMVGLGLLHGDSISSAVNGISGDGLVIVGGDGNGMGRGEAFAWTSSTGMVGLGDLPGGPFGSVAMAASADGEVIVGSGTTATASEAFVWRRGIGMRSLKDILEVDHEIDLTGWNLSEATGLSADGEVIVGSGRNPDGETEPFMAVLSSVDSDGDGVSDRNDNCDGLVNPSQEDLDSDRLGDVCDPNPDAPACLYAGFLPRSSATLAASQNNYCENWFGVIQPNTNLQNSILESADLRLGNFPGSVFVDADLSRADLTGANLANTNLSGAILSGANLTAAVLPFATLASAFYDESTIFPSGKTYENPPWNLPNDLTPWTARMIPTPEPTIGVQLVIGLMGIAQVAAVRRQRIKNRRSAQKSRQAC